MPRVDQINDLLRQKLALLISRDISLENGLITITHADTAPDLKRTVIYISVLPQNISGTALAKIKKNTAMWAKELAKNVRFRKLPRLYWKIDEKEKELIAMEEVFDLIDQEKFPEVI